MDIQELTELIHREYNTATEKLNVIKDIFITQFTEDMVDFEIPCIEEVTDRLLFYRNISELLTSQECTAIFGFDVCSAGDDLTISDMVDSIIDNNFPTLHLIEKVYTPTIIVRFPEVKVENEEGQSIVIQELYARVTPSLSGTLKGTFKLIRSKYPLNQWTAGYTHSHVHSLNRDSGPVWETPCLGTGPIRRTIGSITLNYNEDLWRLFAYELSLYVQNESLSGGPYIRLNTVSSSNVQYSRIYETPYRNVYNSRQLSRAQREFIQNSRASNELIKYVFANKLLKFNFVDGSYNIALSPREFIMIMSNAFIHVWNMYNYHSERWLHANTIIMKAVWREDHFSAISNSGQASAGSIPILGKGVLSFKKKPVKLEVIQQAIENVEGTVFTIVHPDLLSYYATKITNYVNSLYGTNNTTTNIISI